MADYKQIGKNIRSLRLYFGESQEQLGDVIKVSKTAITNYEKGNRELSQEKLTAIAKHFMITVDELMYMDLSKIGSFAANNEFWKYIEIILPIVSSEKAKSNINFKTAFVKHQDGYSLLKKEDPKGLEMLIDSIDDYLIAYEDEKSKTESAVNIIAWYTLVLLSIKNVPTLFEEKNAVIQNLMKKDHNLKRIVDESNCDSDFINDSKDALKELYSSEIVDKINEMKTIVKRSNEWSDLADYYLSLHFIWNIVENELNWAFNQRIGLEMMFTFASVGNHYAISYIASIRALSNSKVHKM